PAPDVVRPSGGPLAPAPGRRGARGAARRATLGARALAATGAHAGRSHRVWRPSRQREHRRCPHLRPAGGRGGPRPSRRLPACRPPASPRRCYARRPMRAALLSLLLTASLASAAPVPGLPELKVAADKFVPTPLKVDVSAMPVSEQKALARLV